MEFKTGDFPPVDLDTFLDKPVTASVSPTCRQRGPR